MQVSLTEGYSVTEISSRCLATTTAMEMFQEILVVHRLLFDAMLNSITFGNL